MAANGELVQEGGAREEGEEDMDMDDEATFSLEFALTGHQSFAFDHHEHEEKDNTEDGNWIHGRQLVAAVEAASHRGDAASSEPLGKVGPAAILRTLVRKLRRWKQMAGPGCPLASGDRAVAALEDGNRAFMAKGEVQPQQPEAARRSGAGAVTSDDLAERWTPTTSEAALKYLSKMPILVCRRGVDDGPEDTVLPVLVPVPVPVPGRRSRGETAGPMRQACKRLGISRSSVAASPPQRRDDSLLHAQDGIASAIAHCKLSSTTSEGTQ